jgi:SAM-dependent methyltransferase
MTLQDLCRCLCCPYEDHGSLAPLSAEQLVCNRCQRMFPVPEGRPVLLDESRSVFSTEEVVAHTDRRLFSDVKGIKSYVRKVLPAGTWEEKTVGLKKHVDKLPENPMVVVIGCGFTGRLFREAFPQSRLLLSDITLQGDADIVCAGECLPLSTNSVDLVVVDQVLEHTCNPLDVVEEIHRCLKPGGMVFSGVPFYYPNHGFPFDFQRFTPLGHRLLYRKFRQIELRLTGGPFSALSLALMGFCQSLWKNLQWSRFTSFLIRLCFRPFLALDRVFQGDELTTTTIAINSVFVGMKDSRLPDLHDILEPYRTDAPQTADVATEGSLRGALP